MVDAQSITIATRPQNRSGMRALFSACGMALGGARLHRRNHSCCSDAFNVFKWAVPQRADVRENNDQVFLRLRKIGEFCSLERDQSTRKFCFVKPAVL